MIQFTEQEKLEATVKYFEAAFAIRIPKHRQRAFYAQLVELVEFGRTIGLELATERARKISTN